MAIGFAPTRETLYLSLHADFIHALTAPASDPFPPTFTAKIEILKKDGTVLATWTPTSVSTSAIGWNIQYSTATTGVDAVITGSYSSSSVGRTAIIAAYGI